MRRIAITAAGIVSPIGRGFGLFADNLLAGTSGVGRIVDVLGDGYGDIPVHYAALVDADLPSTLGDVPVHRSIVFAFDALRQILDSARASEIERANLHCGVGVGQLFPDLDDCRRFGTARVMAEIEAQFSSPRPEPALGLASALRSEHGTVLLRNELNLKGVATTYNGTCSASTQACIAACEDIADGATVAIGGGHDTLVTAGGIYLMHALGTLTEEQKIRPFDVHRDGTLLGEGAAYFLFEDLDHAEARNANVLAEVVGWATSIDGHHLTSPDPSGDPAVQMITAALHHARLEPASIDYVNAHGTSTVLNDTVESAVLKRALRGHPAFVSSTKAQVGHLIAACGAIGLAACLAAIEHQLVPPNPNLRDPDPDCDVALAPAHAVPAKIEYALCNSFGFGGQNGCMILRRPRSSRAPLEQVAS